MAIYGIPSHSAFSPNEIGRIASAYEDVLHVLGLVDRTDPALEVIAKKIMEIAKSGELDPSAIRARAIEELGIPPRATEGACSPMPKPNGGLVM